MNWSGKRVLLTGHTGFKGSWLSLWLQQKGATVCGIALEPVKERSMFEDAKVRRGMRSVIGDIRDLELLKKTVEQHHPEILFHLAAQPLVRSSYEDPVGTYSINVMGTANVLEAVRHSAGVRAVVVVTSDKCYENRQWDWPYRETDRLGGYDPYSSSKTCAEHVVSAYRNSFFNPVEHRLHGVAIATVRAGNVIGGGDWSKDRLIPDVMRAFIEGRSVTLRNPHAIRPWQHVLEALRGYLAVAESLCDIGASYGQAWNFGPDQSDVRPVEWMVNQLTMLWGNAARWEQEKGGQPHEDHSLTLECSRAANRLGWRPSLRLSDGLAMTAAWYRASLQGNDMHAFTLGQIQQYEQHSLSRSETLLESCEVAV
jgi:CDP-glucose 4,6-dehydratase